VDADDRRSELGEHPMESITPAFRRRAAELGDNLPVDWRHRSERYTEKLATPDTAVADLDPMSGVRTSTAGSAAALHLSVAVAPAADAPAVAGVAPVGDPRAEGAGAAATEAASVTVACRAGLHVLVHLPVVSGSCDRSHTV
jgi:hypothetical protein